MIGGARSIIGGSKKILDPFYSNVNLLLMCDGANGSTSFLDSGPRNVPITSNGGAQVSTTSPKFGTGSLQLNGSGQYLSFPPSELFNIGTTPFTLEMWIKMNPVAYNYNRIYGFLNDTLFGAVSESIILEIEGTTGYLSGISCTSSTYNICKDTEAFATGAWTHIALVGTGSMQYLFKNGKLRSSVAYTGAINYSSTWQGRIGYVNTYFASRAFSGNMDYIRFTKGTARYTANFTPDIPTDNLFSYTSLILNCEGANNGTVLTDSSSLSLSATTIGAARTSTTTSKYGTSSLLCSASASNVQYSHVLEFASEPLTIEFHTRTTTTALSSTIIAKMPSAFSSGMWSIVVNPSTANGNIGFYVGDFSTFTPLLVSTGNITDNNWHHVAIVRYIHMWYIYIDGIEAASTLWVGTIQPLSGGFTIGWDQTNGRNFGGYIDNLRITRNAARYSSNFTPPTDQFPGL